MKTKLIIMWAWLFSLIFAFFGLLVYQRYSLYQEYKPIKEYIELNKQEEKLFQKNMKELIKIQKRKTELEKQHPEYNLKSLIK